MHTGVSKQPRPGQGVPLLITWDVDPDPWIPADKRVWALQTAMDACHQLDIRATFFVTAEPADLYAAELLEMVDQGHEVGCHGLTHEDEEEYNRMPEAMQRQYIEKATDRLRALVGVPIRAFRSPRVKASAHTVRLLSEYGYWADSTVCSQRMDLISSNLINTKWLFSPRRPYHPRRDNPFRVGDVPLWEVPVSALILPFISSTHRVVGLQAMKAFFRVLYLESRLTGKPIVYLAHPTEFGNRKAGGGSHFRESVKLRYFSPAFIRIHGFRPRNLLYRVNGEALLESTRSLLGYMASLPDVVPMTVSEYVQQYLENRI